MIPITGAAVVLDGLPPRLPGNAAPGYHECFAAFRERTDRQACLPFLALGLPVARKIQPWATTGEVFPRHGGAVIGKRGHGPLLHLRVIGQLLQPFESRRD